METLTKPLFIALYQQKRHVVFWPEKLLLLFSCFFFLILYPIITSAQFTGRGPRPGDVYKEFTINLPQNNKSWRVTDPNSTFVGEDPDNIPATFLPNPTHSFTIDDFANVERAELVIDLWGGHVGTTGKRIRFNGNSWINIPELNTTPSAGQCFTQQITYTLNIPVSHLLPGNNSMQGTSGNQTCFSFNWGQWGWYGAVIRVYYSTSKGQATGYINSLSTGGTFTDNPVIGVSPSGNVSRIDIVAKYDGYDVDGDGYYNEWVEDYNRRGWANPIQLNSHVGTITSPPYQITWNTEWIPDQVSGAISLLARIRDSNGYWYVSDAVNNLTLHREAYSVKLYKPENVPQGFWVRDGQTKSSNFNIPTLLGATQAQAHIRTWNGRENGASYYSRVNGYTIPAYGRDHQYSYDILPVPIGALNSGNNTFTFHSSTTHHGIEILWPGPAVSVKYGAFTPGTSISVAQHPMSSSVSPGQTVVFSVVANSEAALSYQWRLNGVDIPGANSAVFTTAPVTAVENGNIYSCVVSNGSNELVTNGAILTVRNGLGVRINEQTIDGLSCYRIETSNAIYIYDRVGCGLVSMIDNNGIDWISYNSSAGSSGDFRGIPNSGELHPGYLGGASTTGFDAGVWHDSVVVQSSRNGESATWVFYPNFAKMTLNSIGGTDGRYWILYEGTPGGSINLGDSLRLSNGGEFSAMANHPFANIDITNTSGKAGGSEWMYISADEVDRSIFMAVTDDNVADNYWVMESNMTVMGFGRSQDTHAQLRTDPNAVMVIGFVDSKQSTVVEDAIDLAWSYDSGPSTPPSSPDNLEATLVLPLQIALTWNDNSGNESNFVLERRINGGTFSVLATLGVNASSYTDPIVDPGNTYGYRVKAVNGIGESAYSDIVDVVVPPVPDVPGGLTATQLTVSEVALQWTDNSDNEENFVIERSTNSGGFSVLVTLDADITSHSDETVIPGNTYRYRVKATNVYGESSYSGVANVTVLPAPEAATGVSAIQLSVSEVVLSWEDNSDNEDNFVLERRVNAGAFSVLTTLAEDVTSYEDQAVSVGNTYEYRIKATNTFGESDYSVPVSITVLPAPLAPGDLTANQLTVSEVALSWTDNSDNEDSFVLERRVNGGSFSMLTTLGPNSTNYSDEGVTPGNTYGYRVKAVNAVGESSYSSVANVSVLPAPDAPGSLTASQLTVSEVEINWEDNSDNEDNFVLERRINGGSFSILTTLGSNTTGYSDEAVTPGNTYGYRLKATNAYGESAYSGVANVTVLPAPDAPGGLTATQLTTSEVELSWEDNSDNEDNFVLERRVNSGSFSVLATLVGNVTGYSDETVVPGNTYRYRLKATNAYGESAYSSVASVTVLPAPDAPGGLTATQLTTAEVELSWADNSNNEDNFVVERRVNSGGFAVLTTLGADVTGYLDETVTPGNTYRYRVKATNAYGESAYSGVAIVTVLPAPDAPGSLTATQLTTTEVDLDWTDNSDNEDNFVLERRINSGSFSVLTTLGTNTAGYTDETVTPGNTYGYRVKATNAYGESAYSGVANVTVLPAPDAPGSLTATQLSTTEVDLDWTDNSDNEDNFVVERRINSGSFSVLITLGTNTAGYTDEGVTPGNTYEYRVKARNAYGESDYSGIASVTVLPAPEAPGSLTATQLTTTEVDLGWTDNSDNEDNFVLERSMNGDSFSVLTTLGANTTGYTDEGVTPGNTYEYRVKAANAYGESDYSGVVSVAVLPAPDAPGSLMAIQLTTTTVELSWVDNSDNEDDFVIERRVNDVTFEELAVLPFNTTAYTDATIAPGNFYEYRVKARNTYGDSEYSHEVELTAIPAPAAPGNIEVHQLSETEVSITWEDNSDNEDSFVLERSHNGGGYTELEVLGANTSDYRDHTVVVGNTYSYRLKALNAVGESSYITSLNVIILPGPAVPGNLEASQITETAIALMWTDNSDNEDHFAIERREGEGAFVEVSTVPTNTATYTDVSVMPGNTYVYRVRAVNAFGESGYSNLASVTTIYAPSAPANLTATQMSVNQVSLSWIDNSDNEETFVLERRVNGSAYSELMVLGANEFGYDDVEVEVGSEYEYRIKAVNSVGESSYSNIAAVTILPAPTAPGNLVVSQASVGELTLNWDDMSDNEEGFVIERRINGRVFTELSLVSQNISNFSDQSVAVGNTYEYRVKAVNAIGESGYSNTAGVTVIITSLVAESEQHVSLYPNPLDASKKVRVHFQVPIKGTLKYQIVNLKGEVMGNTTVWIDQDSSTLELDLSTYIRSTGVYFLRITDDQELDTLMKMVYR